MKPKAKTKKVKAWAVITDDELVSVQGDKRVYQVFVGMNKNYYSIYYKKIEIIPCTITYQLPPKK